MKMIYTYVYIYIYMYVCMYMYCVYTVHSVHMRGVLHQVETAQEILGSQKPLPEASTGLKGERGRTPGGNSYVQMNAYG